MILVLKAKHGDYPVYARDKAETERAYLHLFKLMDTWGYYNDLDGDQEDWCREARAGNGRWARELLSSRSDCGYEYEEIEILFPMEP
jgi:hypothetical protein